MTLTLAIIFLTAAAFLFVPFHLILRGRYGGGFEGSLSLTWLWGFFRLESRRDARGIFISGFPVFRTTGEGRMKGRETGKAPAARPGTAAIGIIPHLPFILAMLRKTYRSLSPSGRIEGVLGLGDPTDTGIMLGFLACLSGWLPFLTLVPDFEEETFSIEGCLKLRILLISISILTAQWFLAREGREIIRKVARKEKKTWST